jgi:hypothetical protein
VAAADGLAVGEDLRHRLLQDGKGQRAEEQHGAEQHQAERGAAVEEAGNVGQHGRRLARHQPFKVEAQGGDQFVRRNPVRQRQHRQNDHRHQGEQRVVGDGAGQQQPVVGGEAAQHGADEFERMRHQLAVGTVEQGHGFRQAVRYDEDLYRKAGRPTVTF